MSKHDNQELDDWMAYRHNPTVHYGRGQSLQIPEDAVFISPMRFQASIAAMQGLLNATSVERFTLRIKPEALAQAAVEYADALINELSKPKDENNQ